MRRLRIRGVNAYRKRYRKDSRLPSNPNLYYANKGWSGWRSVWAPKIQPYETHEEFVQAVRKLGIRSVTEYWSRYKEDPRLHCHPCILYAKNGWSGWGALWA
ncbi:MAG: hypothetical protein KC582_01895 [Candidatus Magasanikbacteria bacterium]|nr:hypothetical protein [Candidatus Magasanikbacteria bacterium]